MTNDRKRNPESIDDLDPELQAIWRNEENIYPQPDTDDVAFLYDGMVPTWAKNLTRAAGSSRSEQMEVIKRVLKEIAKYPNLLRLPVDLDEFVPMPEGLHKLFPELPDKMPKRLEAHIQYAASPDRINGLMEIEAAGNISAIQRTARQCIAGSISNNFSMKALCYRHPSNLKCRGNSIDVADLILNGYQNVYADWPEFYQAFDQAAKEEGVTKEAINNVLTPTKEGSVWHMGGVTHELLLPIFFNLVNKGWYYRFLNG